MFFWDRRTVRGGGGGAHRMIWVVTVKDFFFLFVSGYTPDTPQSLALPSSSPAPLIFPALVFCYVTVVIGWAWGRAGGTGNGNGGRSKAREGSSKVKMHRFMLLQQALTEVSYIKRHLIYLYVCLSISVYLLYLFISLFSYVVFISIPPKYEK